MRTSIAILALLLLTSSASAKTDPGLKPGKILHRTSAEHAHPYSLYIPSKYSRKVSWPVVVSSHGRGGSGKGEIRQWKRFADEHGFIVACPDMCTATVNRPPTSRLAPAVEDEQVILSILDELGRQLRLNPRAVMVTGFSGGGNPSYWTGLRHPHRFTHICTRGGNFAPQHIPTDEKILAAGRTRLAIYIYYGEKDHPLILGEGGKPGQAVLAHDALKKAGYANVTIEKIAGMKHQSRADIAAGWFGENLVKNRKAFAAGDKAGALIEKARASLEKGRVSAAIRDLQKAEKIETKAELESRAAKELEAVNARGAKLLAQAKAAREAGDAPEAKKLLGKILRDYRGLPCATEARALQKAWRE